jgi:phospholipid transport system substrate-binding protein
MNMMFRSLLLGLALASPVAGLAAMPEAAPVTALDDGLLSAMKSAAKGDKFAIRAAALTPVITAAYDLPVVAQNSVGFLWATLPASQQAQLIDLFSRFTVASYVSQFSGYHGEAFVLLADEKSLGAAKIVETQIVPGDGASPTELDYVVHHSNGAWRIADVLLGGTISQVAVHESDFAALVKAGDASALISALQAKITTLSGS